VSIIAGYESVCKIQTVKPFQEMGLWRFEEPNRT
jgi:hypothetical protein